MKKVKIVNNSGNPVPYYQKKGDSGVDLYANLETSIELLPMDTVLVPTGVFMEIPEGYEMQVRPRSGLANKYQITVLNTPGTIDSSYRGQVSVILTNFGRNTFIINSGDRIAQGVFVKVEKARFKVTSKLSKTDRGQGGFGSTGVNNA